MDALRPAYDASLTLAVATPQTRRVEALEEALTPVESLPPAQAAQRMTYLRAVSADIAGLRALPLPDLDESAVEGTLQQVFQTSASEVGTEATAAGVAYAKTNKAAAPAAAAPQDEVVDLAERLKKLFPRLDKNKDGVLSHEEINLAMRDPSIKGKDAAALMTLIEIRAQVQWLHHDEKDAPFDQKGVSMKDLDRLGKGDSSEYMRLTGGSKGDCISPR